jgi:hypothetical protein
MAPKIFLYILSIHYIRNDPKMAVKGGNNCYVRSIYSAMHTANALCIKVKRKKKQQQQQILTHLTNSFKNLSTLITDNNNT